MHKTSDDLATISMISDEITMIFCLGIVVSHREMPKVGMVNRLRMRIVKKSCRIPSPLNSPTSTPAALGTILNLGGKLSTCDSHN